MIAKIESLTSKYLAGTLHRQVYVTNRIKSLNESIYYNVDCLHSAIAENKKVSFCYFGYNLDKEKVYRKDGERYIVSPYGLCWDDENYYLITYSEKYRDFTHYRVDRMNHLEMEEEARIALPAGMVLDCGEYAKKTFKMFRGEEATVTLRFENSLINAVLDRFGKDTVINQSEEGYFQIRVNVVVSETFFSWIAMFGDNAKILSPQKVVAEYVDSMKRILRVYEQ